LFFMRRNLETWRTVGRIARDILNVGTKLVKPGAKIFEICEKIENITRDMGYNPAFPVNIGINSVAAHYTAVPYDPSRIPNVALVKLDIGVLSADGAIADTAITIPINVNKKLKLLVEATRCALEKAIDAIKDGIRVGEIGSIIWKTAHSEGFGVLEDLGGHTLSEWKLHGGITIPNVPRRFTPKLRAGMIVAIEPFLVASSEDSHTKLNMAQINIYSIKNPYDDRVLELLYRRFRSLPFALRWLERAKTDKRFYSSMHGYLMRRYMEGKVIVYPTLIEAHNNWVAQFEHTVLVKTNSAEILTGE